METNGGTPSIRNNTDREGCQEHKGKLMRKDKFCKLNFLNEIYVLVLKITVSIGQFY